MKFKFTITITGTLCEVGQLSGENGANGVCIARDDGTFITIKGRNMDEARRLTGLFSDVVNVELSKA